MQENENISTYPEEPTNPNDYVGFEKSVYYIFNLLRLMYYSKVESENKFYSKLGGVIGGNVTIQGNLTVNGVNYAIDTTHLNVEDYTVTLGKDNTTTLTKMAGMIVPKYDGTNSGFFGWDADGYAYVGDITDANFDGKTVTLANNSSLQRIATIDASGLSTVANGKVMVWDTVAHEFKTAPNGTYLIKNGNLETADADEIDDTSTTNKFVSAQEKENINNALYNIGAYDTISGNVASRGHWRLTKKDFKKQDGGWFTSAMAPSSSADRGVSANMTFPYQYSYSFSSSHWYYEGGAYAFCVSNDDIDNIVIDYKTLDTYQEDIIPNTPLLDLDSNGCNFLREEWEKSLQIWDETYQLGYWQSSNGAYIYANNQLCSNKISVKPNTTYTITFTDSSYSIHAFNGNTWLGLLVSSPTANITTFTTPSNCNYITFNTGSSYGATYNHDIMLNSGTHAYPYQEYNGEIVHKADINGLNYSTTEVNTGFTWINGKTIYKKTFVLNNIALTTEYTKILNNSEGMTYIIRYEVIFYSVSGIYNDTTGSIAVRSDGIYYEYSNNWQPSTSYFTLYYIK